MALQYETVAAGQTAQVLGTTGAVGDFIERLIITPSAVGAGVVTLIDNATSIPIYAAGANLVDLTPITVPLGVFSVSGAWKVTTGATVTVVAIGSFT
jgi:hypothetical protein